MTKRSRANRWALLCMAPGIAASVAGVFYQYDVSPRSWLSIMAGILALYGIGALGVVAIAIFERSPALVVWPVLGLCFAVCMIAPGCGGDWASSMYLARHEEEWLALVREHRGRGGFTGDVGGNRVHVPSHGRRAWFFKSGGMWSYAFVYAREAPGPPPFVRRDGGNARKIKDMWWLVPWD